MSATSFVLGSLIAVSIVLGGPTVTLAANFAQFDDLSKRCKATDKIPPSDKGKGIARVAMAEHKEFDGNRVDHTGRMIFFGHGEAESDQKNGRNVGRKDIPWQKVLTYWEAIDGSERSTTHSPEDALKTSFYQNVLASTDSPIVPDKMKLEKLLTTISRIDLSATGEDEPRIRAALQQSVIRSSISDVPWSAAFVSATMRQAKLTRPQFAFSAAHVTYIRQAIKQSVTDVTAGSANAFYRACDPQSTMPRVGDLYCYHRHVEGTSDVYKPRSGFTLFRSLFADFVASEDNDPISRSHCDIIVKVDDASKKVHVIGGNVQNSVTEKILNITEQRHCRHRKERKSVRAIIQTSKAQRSQTAI
ncbi:DUF2272 domain-containing protein [Bradyrhizobium sp. JYMT SZCCT0180]|uniref:DUF2272 domain-containing protein n=1 Tax=Bradyrhizobium sp. JYMT SZCCT0180 TaxID=2807666 RepID=UPI001BA7282F|nr:DUF2272 domain-containing protein [Bradyrhizobium sp. JYMT SZCCT0180]MBR1209713.1 DUF2272 domain-containing protein [Bradyrhizobium sp. JYMT SZCCT0180]